MKVYHGSIIEIPSPLVSLGRRNLDFGEGFYVTDIREQAVKWAERISRRKLMAPVLNVYEFDIDSALKSFRYLKFDSYNRAWLDFIVGNRKGKCLWQEYDVVEGGVANDNVIDTVEDYINGRMSAEAALVELSRHQPNNQICILNQEIIDSCFHFVESQNLQCMLRPDQMWYKIGGVVMTLSEQLGITPERALELFYKSKTCDDLHNPETMLYTFSNGYIADEVIAEYRGMQLSLNGSVFVLG